MNIQPLNWKIQPDFKLICALKDNQRDAYNTLIERYSVYIAEVIDQLVFDDDLEHLRLSLLTYYKVWEIRHRIPAIYAKADKPFGPYLKGLIFRKFLHLRKSEDSKELLHEMIKSYDHRKQR